MRNRYPAYISIGVSLLLLLSTSSLALAQAKGAGTRFKVQKVQVVGNTVLTQPEISKLTLKYEGQEESLDDLHKLAASLTQAYRDKGYFLALATLPPQQVEGGEIEITVSEGRIGKIVVQGNKLYSTAFIQKHFAMVQTEKVASRQTLERAVQVVNEYPDINVRVQLKRGSVPDTTDVFVKVTETKRFHSGTDYDNLGNELTGQNHGGLSLDWGHIFKEGDSLQTHFTAVFPTGNNTPLAQLAYTFPVDSVGSKIALTFSSADFLVGEQFAILNLQGNIAQYGVPIQSSRSETSAGDAQSIVGYDTKSFANFALNTQAQQDNIRDMRLAYSVSWNEEKHPVSHTLLLSLSQGLGTFLGGTAEGDPLASRAGASDSFSELDASYLRVQPLGKFQLQFRFAGQAALQPLLLGEQFPLGGIDSVRGFIQSELLADEGFAASAELHVPLDKKGRTQGAVFIDHGGAYTLNAQPGQIAVQHLTGAGVGIRTLIGKTAFLRADVGYPLDPGVGISGQRPVLYFQFNAKD